MKAEFTIREKLQLKKMVGNMCKMKYNKNSHSVQSHELEITPLIEPNRPKKES